MYRNKDRKEYTKMAHLPLKKLLAFRHDQLSIAEKAAIQTHLDTCSFCSKNLTLLVQPGLAIKISPAVTGTPVVPASACLTLETIVQYLNQKLDARKLLEAESHLAWCEQCQHQLAEISRISADPVSEEEKKRLDALPPFDVAEQAQAISDLMRTSKTSNPSIKDNSQPLAGWHWILPHGKMLRPAFVLTAVLLFSIAGKWWAWPALQYGRLVAQSEAQLKDEHAIPYRDAPRPAGDYPSTAQTTLLAPGEENQTLEAMLLQALTYKREGEAARRKLAQYYLLSRRYEAADSLLKILESAAPNDAALLNDRGIWFYHRHDYAAAAAAFHRAFTLNSRLDEALYNLALAQIHLGDTGAAKTSWEKYLTLEHAKLEWKKAVAAQLQELK